MAVDDSYTIALLHCNGADASITFADESGKTWTANGNAQIDTAQSKFGGASGLFDGTGDYITTPDSDDWRLDDGSNANAWTIDFWIRFSALPAENIGLIQQYVSTDNGWRVQMLYSSGHYLNFRVRSAGSSVIDIKKGWSPSLNTWYHVAIVKNGTTGYLLFVDGTQLGTTEQNTTVIPNFAGDLRAGSAIDDYGTARYLNGWIDELRISKGVARWTSGFTPPAAEYAPPSIFVPQVIWF